MVRQGRRHFSFDGIIASGSKTFIFSHMSSVKGREGLIMCGRTRRLRTGKKSKGSGQLTSHI